MSGRAAIAPVDLVDGPTIEAWGDPDVRAWFLDAYRHGVPPVTSLAMEANQPDVLRAWSTWWWALFHGGVVDPALKERLRIEIAAVSGCLYCATSSMPTDPMVSKVTPTGRPDDAIVDLGRRLAIAPWSVVRSDIEAVHDAWPAAAATELLAFVAWQVGGPRVLRSWGADRWKVDGRVDLDRLPAAMAYRAEYESGARAALPPAPANPSAEPDAVRWSTRAGAPSAWLRLLAPRPDLLAAWVGLFDATVKGSTLAPHIGALVRRELATLLAFPAWASDTADMLPDVRAGRDAEGLDAQERAALAYVRALVLDTDPQGQARDAIATGLSMAQRVELGFAVAVQLGPLLVLRAGAADGAAVRWA